MSYKQFKLDKSLEEAFDDRTVMSGKYFNNQEAIQSWIKKQHKLMDYEDLVLDVQERYGLTTDEAEYAIADTLGLGESYFIKIRPSQLKKAEIVLLEKEIPHQKLDDGEFKFNGKEAYCLALGCFHNKNISVRN